MRKWGSGGDQTKKNQFRRVTSDVSDGPVVRSSGVQRRSYVRRQGDFQVRDEQPVDVVERLKFVESGRFRGWKGGKS